jgi:hypothetical protein
MSLVGEASRAPKPLRRRCVADLTKRCVLKVVVGRATPSISPLDSPLGLEALERLGTVSPSTLLGTVSSSNGVSNGVPASWPQNFHVACDEGRG